MCGLCRIKRMKRPLTLTKNELDEILYCMEQMYSAYSDDEPSYQHWLTAINKIDSELKQLE